MLVGSLAGVVFVVRKAFLESQAAVPNLGPTGTDTQRTSTTTMSSTSSALGEAESQLLSTLALPKLATWGTYRPHAYFGIKSRHPKSPVFGVMWYNADDPQWFNNIRHEADAGDAFTTLEWLHHDGESTGSQSIVDIRGGMNVTTTFIRGDKLASVAGHPAESSGNGALASSDSIYVRVRLEPLSDTVLKAARARRAKQSDAEGAAVDPEPAPTSPTKVSFMWYVATDDKSDQVELFVPEGSTNIETHFSFNALKNGERSSPWYVLTARERCPMPPHTAPCKRKLSSDFEPKVSLTKASQMQVGPEFDYSTMIRELFEDTAGNENDTTIDANGVAPKSVSYLGVPLSSLADLKPTIRQTMLNLYLERMRRAIDLMAKYEEQRQQTRKQNNLPPHHVRLDFNAVPSMLPRLPREFLPGFVTGASEAAHKVMIYHTLLSFLSPAKNDAQSPLPVEFEFIISPRQQTDLSQSPIIARVQQLSSDELVHATRATFDAAFAHGFPSLSASLNKNEVKIAAWNNNDIEIARRAVASLLGGVGYWHGDAKWKRRDGKRYKDDVGRNLSLLSGSPSRICFARGFLWDEGMHLRVTMRMNPKLAWTILWHWSNLIQPSGWLPREQIIGEESRRRVPSEFVPQRDDVTNPPTMILTFHAMVKQALKMGSPQGDEFLHIAKIIYPAFQRHLDWLLKGQSVDAPKDLLRLLTGGDHESSSIGTNVFKWQARTANHCLDSGMDDYPRAPTAPGESKYTLDSHVDLVSWLIAATRAMSQIAESLRTTLASSSGPVRPHAFDKDATHYAKVSRDLSLMMHKVFYDPVKRVYADVYIDNVGTAKDPRYVKRFVHHNGYVSLMPLILQAIPSDIPESKDVYDAVLTQLAKPQLLSPWGIRSLAVDDPLFATKENYWRGNIWAPINYLAVIALRDLVRANAFSESKMELARKVERNLRTGFVRNVLREHRERGHFFEQYTAKNGYGTRCRAFTGWTALFTDLMEMKDV